MNSNGITIANTEESFWKRVTKNENGCWIFSVPKENKFKTHATIGFKGKKWDVHRLAWTFVNGEIPKNMFVLHKCDVGVCVNPDHLFLGTAKDNTQDMHNKGRWCDRRGEKNPMSKLTKEQALSIKASSKSTKELSEEYNIDMSQIRRIQTGKAWKNLSCNDEAPQQVKSERYLTPDGVWKER